MQSIEYTKPTHMMDDLVGSRQWESWAVNKAYSRVERVEVACDERSDGRLGWQLGAKFGLCRGRRREEKDGRVPCLCWFRGCYLLITFLHLFLMRRIEVLHFRDIGKQRVPMFLANVHGLAPIRVNLEYSQGRRQAVVHITVHIRFILHQSLIVFFESGVSAISC